MGNTINFFDFQLSLILSIVQAAKVHGLYAMLGLSLLGQAIIVVILVSLMNLIHHVNAVF
jgi:hypothetical protein